MADSIPDGQMQPKHIDGPVGLPPDMRDANEFGAPGDGQLPHELDDSLGDMSGDYTPQAEQGLAALRDSPAGVKPYYPYSTLIRYAIKGAPGQRLLLEDIYSAIEHRFPYFKNAPTGWKNSVRHNLSLNPCFVKISRPLTDRGKGAYWTVNDKIDPRQGVHRDRKKKSRGGKARKRRGGDDDDSDSARESPQPGDNANGAMQGAGGMVDENGNRIQFAAWPGYGPGMYPMQGPRYVLDPNEEEHGPEFDEGGSPIWRTVWLNELVKLRRATFEQDTTTNDPEWYRAMVERVRSAFLPPEQHYIQAAEEGEEHGGEGEEAEA